MPQAGARHWHHRCTGTRPARPASAGPRARGGMQSRRDGDAAAAPGVSQAAGTAPPAPLAAQQLKFRPRELAGAALAGEQHQAGAEGERAVLPGEISQQETTAKQGCAYHKLAFKHKSVIAWVRFKLILWLFNKI